MVTWLTLKERLIRTLDDTDRADPTWSDQELLDYANEALTFISQHTAQEKVVAEVLAAEATTYALPDGALALGPVWVESGSSRQLARPMRLEPGNDLSLSVSTALRNAYWEYPAGTLNFFRPVPAGATLRVYYFAFWDAIVDDDSTLLIPRWMEEPLKWYVMAQALTKPGAQAAVLAQYKTKRDSGDPEDNSLLVYARYCMRQYERLMAHQAEQDRSGWEGR